MKLQNRKTNIISLSSPSTTGIFLDKMSNKEQQECLDVVTLVNTLKNNNNDDGNNTVNDMDDNSLSSIYILEFKWEKLNDSNPSYGVVNVSMKIHIHIYHIVNINFQLINILISCPGYVVVVMGFIK